MYISNDKYSEKKLIKEDTSFDDDFKPISLENIDKKINFLSNIDDVFIAKEKKGISKLNKLNIGSDEFKELMQLHHYNKQSILETIELKKVFDEINDSDSSAENNSVKTFLEALKINRDNFHEKTS